MTKDEIQKVRDALARFAPIWSTDDEAKREALAILDRELAKPGPEPVGEVVRYIFGTHEGIRFSILPTGMLLQIGTKLYTTPPAAKEWVGLTDEEMLPEIKKCANYYGYINKPMHLTAGAGFFGLARAIEDALRAKNTGEQA